MMAPREDVDGVERRAGRFSRRVALTLPAAVAGTMRIGDRTASGREAAELVVSAAPVTGGGVRFDRRDFGIVGVYDVDWLTQPGFERLLDNLAASPGAFHGVRFFGTFTADLLELIAPESGGSVWSQVDQPIDFSAIFDALEALTSRGLTPFVVLGFFPPAVSSSPIQPPAGWDDWKRLVRTFFVELSADPRFGASAIADWWFEVWNEPNEGRFWSGTNEEYLALYRATSEAIGEAGVAIRLGGPAIAYKPQVEPDSGAPWIDRFLSFIAADKSLRCDFVSLHRKGTVADDRPDPRRLYTAALKTADQALSIDAKRFQGLTIVDDEADEKVGFEVPYAPRVDERNAAWLGAVAAIHANLAGQYQSAGMRFVAAADNANLQLVRAPFDGRRSLMTLATPDAETDLLKVPAFGFYEMLRLLGDRQCVVTSGAELVFPDTDLYHLPTAGGDSIASLIAYYPDPYVQNPALRSLDYVITDIPWSEVNVARFQIDRSRSSAYSAAGGSPSNPFPLPDPEKLRAIRLAQEVSLFQPIARDVPVIDGSYRATLAIEPYTTLCLWITPVLPTVPDAPEWIDASIEEGNVILRWSPDRAPYFFSYELFLMDNGETTKRLSPEPLRAALWIDTSPPAGQRTYGVRAVSASGEVSDITISHKVSI